MIQILFGYLNGPGCGDLPHMGGNFTSKKHITSYLSIRHKNKHNITVK
jgi:hypothetical protein